MTLRCDFAMLFWMLLMIAPGVRAGELSWSVRPLEMNRLAPLKNLDLNDVDQLRLFLQPYADVRVVFVLGAADERFVRVNHAHWENSLDYDDFSQKDALGRMLCPQQGKNKSEKYLIVIRADATDDTLWHEFLHYLQAKRDPNVCKVYKNLEAGTSPPDIADNFALEYEVVRLIYENRTEFPLSEIGVASIVEKLMIYQKQIPNLTARLNGIYGWKELKVEELAAVLQKLVSDFSKKGLDSRYGPALAADVRSRALLRAGFSFLDEAPFTWEDLPVCLNVKVAQPALKKLADQAVAVWNTVGKDLLEKEFFNSGCEKPRVSLEVNEKFGVVGDGIFKVAYVEGKDERKIVIRQKEFLDYENMLSAIVRKRRLANRGIVKDDTALTQKLEQFKNQKLAVFFLHTVIHELGHALGLGHNFNESEKSVMNYSDHVVPSAYDREAIAFLFKKKPPTREWRAELTPPKSQLFSE